MSETNFAFKGAAEIFGATTKTFTGVFNFARGSLGGVISAVQDARLVASLEQFEIKSGKIQEVREAASNYIASCENSDKPIPTNAQALAYILKQRASIRANTKAISYKPD